MLIWDMKEQPVQSSCSLSIKTLCWCMGVFINEFLTRTASVGGLILWVKNLQQYALGPWVMRELRSWEVNWLVPSGESDQLVEENVKHACCTQASCESVLRMFGRGRSQRNLHPRHTAKLFWSFWKQKPVSSRGDLHVTGCEVAKVI